MNINNVKYLESVATPLLNKELDNLGEFDEDVIPRVVNLIVPIAQLSASTTIIGEEIDRAISNLEQIYEITMDTGAILKGDNNKKWYYNSKATRGTLYWDRYYTYLERDVSLPRVVINKVDEASEDIMDVLGDPLSEAEFSRKGLVIGAVQSGKTSNYIALINKAADSGYKVIILLTGTIEKLRRQTQTRIDEGFIGMDSRDITEQRKKKKFIGVGKYNRDIMPASFTSSDNDFNANSLNMKLSSVNGPVIFVVKKNKAVLEKLKKWLKEKNDDLATGKIDFPLLLIDDEADNASVNTNKDPDKSPTAINREIRALLKLFTKYSYVGFTATPFANIFIDPFVDDKTKEDLFPKDFIYLLEQPSNYVGPTTVYSDNGEYNYLLRYNDDMEDILPLLHKNGTIPVGLPTSLKVAIKMFMLTNAIRDLRGQESKHRSMLIHVSRFINVQESVTERVKNYFYQVRDDIKAYILADEEHPTIKDLRNLFEKEFGSSAYPKYEGAYLGEKEISGSWEEVKNVLFESIAPIQIRTVNSNSASKMLNYDEYEGGLRIIAVGGLSLARGLTLEGLSTSYFYRNTKMYDTLMQMGRWFGYRDGYVDLCRLWTSEESAGWYSQIADATEELKNDLKRMGDENKKPIDFGLRVRSSNETPLIVTAKNKMHSTEKMKLERQLNGKMIETAILPKLNYEIDANNEVIEKWLLRYQNYLVTNHSLLGKETKPTYKDIPKEAVIDLLRFVEYPYMNEFSKNGDFVKEIKNSKSTIFEKWDVVIATNDSKANETSVSFGGLNINPVKRSFDLFGTGKYVRSSGSKKRLGATEYALTGLYKKEYEKIENIVKQQLKNKKTKSGKPKSPSQNMYFNTGIDRNPLIVIYPIKLMDKKKENPEITSYLEQLGDRLISGMSIGIPDIKGVESTTYEYVINRVYQMELIEGTSISEDWDQLEDDPLDE